MRRICDVPRNAERTQAAGQRYDVRLNNLTDNMDIRRLPYLSDKDVKRLKKYLKAYKRLSGEPVYSVYACRTSAIISRMNKLGL